MRVGVIGAGSWGTAIAWLLGGKGYSVHIWARSAKVVQEINDTHKNSSYLPDCELPHTVDATSNLSECVAGVDALVLVTPSKALREVCVAMALYVAPKTPVCVLTKGVEHDTGYMMSEVVGEVLGHPKRVCVLTGPNHAEEVSQGKFAAAVVASYDADLALYFQKLFMRSSFRVYTSEDVVGVEICAASKNYVAIAVGAASAAGFGDNTAAVIMTRGLAEMSRLVFALGGNAQTCMGLSGMGDLVATCTSENSRNRTFGESLVRGESLDEYMARRHMIVEGAYACKSIQELAKKLHVELPLAQAVTKLIYHKTDIHELAQELIQRLPTEEFYGYDDKPTTSWNNSQ